MHTYECAFSKLLKFKFILWFSYCSTKRSFVAKQQIPCICIIG